MKALKPILILAVLVGAVVAAVKYTGDETPTLPDETSVTRSTDDDGTSSKKDKKEAPRLEERYGVVGPGFGP